MLALVGEVDPAPALEVIKVMPRSALVAGAERDIRAAQRDPFALADVEKKLGIAAAQLQERGAPARDVAVAKAIRNAVVDAIDRPTDGYYRQARKAAMAKPAAR
ncbi:MAG: hypothetical protein KIS96_10990 [Bauldia sp.]|nr:hypothetical protein [Bauldia sp.]